VVIPALNEAAALPLVLADLARQQRARPVPRLAEIVVVDNGSTDATATLAARAGATVLHEPRRGYGAACLHALAHLRQSPPDIVVFMDADRSDDVDDLPALLQPLLESGFDMVVGSRARPARARLPAPQALNWL
jgi:glycosyltransferase involved in cell wall biosynthesis